jgi:hypothetical protein
MKSKMKKAIDVMIEEDQFIDLLNKGENKLKPAYPMAPITRYTATQHYKDLSKVLEYKMKIKSQILPN